MLRSVAWFVGALVLGGAGDALAKGEGGGISGFCFGQNTLAANTVRFPEALPATIVASTNFGLLVSRDAGGTWGWVCPEVYGAQIAGNFTLFVLPGVATLPEGTIVVLSGGLGYWISSEEACRYESAPDPDLRSATVVSVAARAAAPGVVYAALSWPGRTPFGVWRSDDGGDEFAATELQSDDQLRFGSVHLTPGAERLYVTTRSPDGQVGLWRSDDGIGGWTEGAAQLTAVGSTIVASRAGHPDEVYVEATESISGACLFDVSLQRSADGGDSYEPVAQKNEIFVGAVVDEDGAVWMGWKDSGLEVWRDGVVEPVEGSPAPIGCLVRSPDGALVVCPLGDPDALVSVRDPDTGAFEPLLTLDRITGPLECPDDTPVGRECTDRWNELAAFWGLGGVVPGGDAGPGDPDGGGAGSDGGGGGGGDDDDSSDDGPGGDGDGCSCAVAGGSAVPAPVGVVALVLCALLAGRRRRHRLTGVAVALAGLLSGCGDDVDPWSRPIEWGLAEDEYWPDLRQVHGVGEGRILVTNNLDDTVSVLDLALVGDDALSELSRAPVGFIPVEREGPHHVTADPSGEFYYVGISNYVPGAGSGPHGVHGSGSADGHILKLRATDDLPVASVRVDRNPGDTEMTPDGTALLVTHFDMLRISEVIAAGGTVREMDSRIAIVDPVTMERVAMVDACPAAHGIVVTPDGAQAIVSCLPDQIAVLDLVAADHPVRRVDVIADPGPVSSPICSPYALTMTPGGDTVWVSCYGDGRVLAYDVASGEMDPARVVGPLPGRAVFGTTTRDGRTLLVPHQVVAGIAIIDEATGELQDDVFLDPTQCFEPHVVRFSDDETLLMVVCEGNRSDPGTFVVLDRQTMTIQKVVPLGIFPDDIAILRAPR